MHAADPVPPRPNLAVRRGKEIFAERRAKSFKHLLRVSSGMRRLISHGMSFASRGANHTGGPPCMDIARGVGARMIGLGLLGAVFACY
jgi:hypothetical protein